MRRPEQRLGMAHGVNEGDHGRLILLPSTRVQRSQEAEAFEEGSVVVVGIHAPMITGRRVRRDHAGDVAGVNPTTAVYWTIISSTGTDPSMKPRRCIVA